MSIITEALKKAELEKKLKKAPEKETVSTIRVPISQPEQNFKKAEELIASVFKPYVPKKINSGIPIKLLLVFLLTVGAAVGGIFFLGDYLAKKQSVIIIPPPAPKESGSPSVNTSAVEFSFDVSAAQKSPGTNPAVKIPAVKITEEPKSKFVLTGVMNDPEKPSAFINNELVEVGQMVSGAKVIQIDSNTVTLDDNGRQIKLTL